jgi:catechol 2,3-dioxygenase-like lactoylglutathione lyase family enzyme
MKIEHTAYQVEDPVALARWYVTHLGLRVARSQSESPFGHFLSDDGDTVLLEFYRQAALPVPDYRGMDPLVLHLAFLADDVPATRARLIAAGATPVGDTIRNPAGDEVAMLRDPWGLAIQLIKRAQPMIRG